MGFAFFDHGRKRHWMSEGNVRSAQDIVTQGVGDEVLKEFLERNTISTTSQHETVFIHPDEQTFRATQTPPNIAGDVDEEETKKDKK